MNNVWVRRTALIGVAPTLVLSMFLAAIIAGVSEAATLIYEEWSEVVEIIVDIWNG